MTAQTDARDLPSRLTVKAAMISLGEKIEWGSEVGLMHEAANRIEADAATIAAKDAEIERLRALVTSSEQERYRVCGELALQLEQERAEIARKDEALAPFAEAPQFASANDDYRIIANITVGDLRRARAARSPT